MSFQMWTLTYRMGDVDAEFLEAILGLRREARRSPLDANRVLFDIVCRSPCSSIVDSWLRAAIEGRVLERFAGDSMAADS